MLSGSMFELLLVNIRYNVITNIIFVMYLSWLINKNL
jgi:hypothetical protein